MSSLIKHSSCRGAVIAAVLIAFPSMLHAGYRVERVLSGLNQPIYMTQAPNDNNSLYIVERADNGNVLGRIRKYDQITQTSSTFLDMTGGITSDGGVLSMAFSPNYQTNGLFYVASNASGVNRLDEYQTIGGVPTFQRRLLQYNNLDNVYHTINWIGFRPGGGANELFVTTGDGGTQANSANFNKTLIESLDSPYGKILRVDTSGSFPTPAADPTHASIDVVARGLRNPYRASFDRQTGGMFIGDVGFIRVEEVSYLSASTFANPGSWPVDFGWTDREGTISTGTPFAGGPGSPGDINPIFDYVHQGYPLNTTLPHVSLIDGESITAGYVYRGPVPELQGKYFFADFNDNKIYSMDFNQSTPVASYNGANTTNLVNRTTEFNNLVPGGANIQRVTSFAEDNAGNLYIVKFGNGFFPPLGEGEIFRIMPDTTLQLTVDRTTGSITLGNFTGAALDIASYNLTSAFGAINFSGLTPITGNYDLAGNDFVDDDNNWSITSPGGSFTTFAEASLGDPGRLTSGQQVVLSAANGWLKSNVQDLALAVVLGNGSVLNAVVSYTGNSGAAFARGDLNFDGAINVADWNVFKASGYAPISVTSGAQRYALGDLDNDGDNDYADFRTFKALYNAVNGVGALEVAIASVPEPGGLRMVGIGLAAILLLAGASFRPAEFLKISAE